MHEHLPGQIEERLKLGIRDAQRTRVTPEAMNLDCLAGKALHRIVPRKSRRVFGDECVMPSRLVEVIRDAVCRDEGEERIEQLADVLEIQELRQEGERLWIREGDWHDRNFVKGFWSRRWSRKHGEVGTVEREDGLVDRIHHDALQLRTRGT